MSKSIFKASGYESKALWSPHHSWAPRPKKYLKKLKSHGNSRAKHYYWGYILLNMLKIYNSIDLKFMS